jgi:hypothetical protein
MTKMEIPNLHRFKNRHGKWQTYYRAAGRGKIRLRAVFEPGILGGVRGGKGDARPEIGAGAAGRRSTPRGPPLFLVCVPRLAPGGQRGAHPELVRDLRRWPSQGSARSNAAMIDARATKPGAARDLLKRCAACCSSVRAGLRADDPTIGVAAAPPHRRLLFVEADIAKYRAFHAS